MNLTPAQAAVSTVDRASTDASPAPGPTGSRTHPSHAQARLAAGPILPAMLKLALPILVVLAIQTAVGVAETYFVSSLGVAAIAGVALVFPALMLMTMMSNGGVGGGVSSAVSRAIGGGRTDDADALVLHAIVVGIVFGLLFTAVFVLGGRWLYASLGGSHTVLDAALTYSNLVFGAAVPIWIVNLAAAALRGAGEVRVPAVVTVAGAVLTLLLSPALIHGWGPFPAMGVAGAGWAMITYYLVATGVLLAYLRSGASPIRLLVQPLQWRLFRQILGVGLMSALGTVTANATVLLALGLVGAFGANAIAAYGIASRIDYLLVPVLFAIGAASVTLVGLQMGAGRVDRARRIAWVATALSASVCAVVAGLAVAAPRAWAEIFTHDPAVVATSVDYLRRVSIGYVFFGAGMALYFASQGAGRVLWPIVAGLVRLLVVVVFGGIWVRGSGGDLTGLFWIIAASYVAMGLINLAAFGTGVSWRRAVPRRPAG